MIRYIMVDFVILTIWSQIILIPILGSLWFAAIRERKKTIEQIRKLIFISKFKR